MFKADIQRIWHPLVLRDADFGSAPQDEGFGGLVAGDERDLIGALRRPPP